MLTTYVVSRPLSRWVIIHTVAILRVTHVCSPSSPLKTGYHAYNDSPLYSLLV